MTALRDTFDKTYEKGGFTYVSWSQVADRLDEAAGNDWSFEIRQLGDDWCWGRLTIGELHYENVGYAENATADWKKEALKDAVSDALKRCAALAGVGRYLYDKDAPSTNGYSAPPRPPQAAVAAPARPSAPADDPFGDTLDEFAPVGSKAECPIHHKPWKENAKGKYCSGKMPDGSWCNERP